MGNLTAPEYESLDGKTLSDKTQAGGVKHNGTVSLETWSLPFGRQARRPEATEADAMMANDLLIQPETESEAAAAIMAGCELDLYFRRSC